MTQQAYDVAIAGLGAMGSAAACHLGLNGARVIGFDRFHPPHDLGSSHGESRIIRQAYIEDPRYVPMVQRAYELWADLEDRVGARLLQRTGGVMIGEAGSDVVQGARASAEQHGLEHEVLDAEEIRRRFPALSPADEMCGVYEPAPGVLFPEECVASHLRVAADQGADLRFEEEVTGWVRDGSGVKVITPSGAYRAGMLLIAAGAWLPYLAPGLDLPLTVERQVMFWFRPSGNPAYFLPGACPVSVWEYDSGKRVYALPDMGTGFKAARHHDGERTDAHSIDRTTRQEDEETVKDMLRRYIPGGNGPVLRSSVCMYTDTPDFHFLVDYHPDHSNVLIASPCSGHGFKFASMIGEMLSEMLLKGQSRFDLGLFSMSRLMDR
ncbi:MAG: N-methyl-L-tryptophan oxidase [Chloroflexota bacterium]